MPRLQGRNEEFGQADSDGIGRPKLEAQCRGRIDLLKVVTRDRLGIWKMVEIICLPEELVPCLAHPCERGIADTKQLDRVSEQPAFNKLISDIPQDDLSVYPFKFGRFIGIGQVRSRKLYEHQLRFVIIVVIEPILQHVIRPPLPVGNQQTVPVPIEKEYPRQQYGS